LASNDLSRREFRRILIIKPSSFGDVIHALPVLHGLRRRFPRARISWLVNHNCAELLEGQPALDEIIRFDRKRYGRVGRGLAATTDFVRFIADLQARRFDLALDLQGLFRSGFLTFCSGAPVRIGFSSAREFAWAFYTERVAVRDPNMHAVDRNWLFARKLGFDDGAVKFHLEVQPQAQASVRRMLAEGGLQPGQPYLLMAPGTRWETKIWPAAHFAEVARQVRDQYGLSVVLTGMGTEAPIAHRVASMSSRGIIDVAGRTSLAELIALVEGAAAVVMHDSGPMHLASALGKPMVAIYGPTSPARTGPYRRESAVTRLDLPCSPCYLKTIAECPHGHRCMNELRPQEVLERLARVLSPAAYNAALVK
jgi:heptosyltransferase I